MAWTAAVDSSQGRRHRALGAPCQDFGRLAKPSDDVLVGALADGAGGAALSHLGAQAAVSAALDLMEARLSDDAGLRGDPAGGPGGAEALFDGVLDAARGALARQAQGVGQPVDAFATTLLVFAAGPRGVAAFQVGDGWLVGRTAEGVYRLLSRPQRGEYANETVFVTSPDAEDAATVTHSTGPAGFLCASTDGLTAVSIENCAEAPHAPFFRPLDRFMAETADDAEAHHAIRGFLRSERLQARVEDDVTLLLGGWRPLGRA